MKSGRLINASQRFDIYLVATEFENARKDADAILLVDIAGGPGQEVERFKQRNPHIPDRCVLQDPPLTLRRIDKLHEGIEAMAYDFFTPQPPCPATQAKNPPGYFYFFGVVGVLL